jgi:hypothetical protein
MVILVADWLRLSRLTFVSPDWLRLFRLTPD